MHTAPDETKQKGQQPAKGKQSRNMWPCATLALQLACTKRDLERVAFQVHAQMNVDVHIYQLFIIPDKVYLFHLFLLSNRSHIYGKNTTLIIIN